MLGDRAGAKPAKSGEWDESVVMDWSGFEWVGLMLAALRERRPSGPLWSLDSALLTTCLHQAANLSDVEVLEPQLYSLRHGGASHDALAHLRSLPAIKQRGRWKSDTSIRNYEKHAAALREAHRLPPRAVTFARRVESQLTEVMLGLRPSLVPPRASEPLAALSRG